ncbi:calbindin-32-like isoform X2 [Paramacrobiotus metropolitanus]|uniref:calbindin-32-like isoform X2 n=1 Tax=Paramacrobiotus metropolitanus TaxID=2943436 RepID=UPI00244654B8|nr:calbindin-32-like isoform X2 [Paramacrobiotus metropolitanus]
MYQQGAQTRNFINTKLLKHYGKLQPLSATQFIEIWNHYDKDGNNYLENQEIDSFLYDFLNSALSKTKAKLTQMEAKELKAEFLKEFDQNKDGKISVTELSYILPARQRFYLLYRLGNQHENNSHGAKDYMETWKKYDKDLSGFIEKDELKSFLGDLLAKVNPDGAANEKKLERYTREIMEIFDINKDGKLELSELVHLLPKEENFVQIVLDKALTLDRLYGNDVKLLIEHYDKDNSGTLEAEELDNLLRDVLVASQTPGKTISAGDVQELKASLMKACDLDANGRLNAKELSVLLLAIANSQRSGEGYVKSDL